MSVVLARESICSRVLIYCLDSMVRVTTGFPASSAERTSSIARTISIAIVNYTLAIIVAAAEWSSSLPQYP